MDDDDVERFEITDYDIQSALLADKRKKGFSREQQIYGIWSVGSEDEEEKGSSSAAAPALRSKFLHGGMNFVAGGVQRGPDQDRLKKDGDEKDEGARLPPCEGSSSDEDGGISSKMPTSFGRPQLLTKMAPREKPRELAGLRQLPGKCPLGGSGSIAEWEKYTTGIGSKLLKQMGYQEGKGLGKDLQGISTPVEASKRKGKGAIGFYGSERSDMSLQDFPAHDSDEEGKTKFEEQLKQWKKTGTKKNIIYNYKSAEDVIQEGKSKKLKNVTDSHITQTKVIDMTGPEMRVLSSYHAIGGQAVCEVDDKKNTYEHFDLPELVHNIQILLEKCEDDILRNARTLERERDRIVTLDHEREKYETLLERETSQLASFDKALVLIEKLEEKHSNHILTLTEGAGIFEELMKDYSQIYLAYDIAYLAPTFITPLLKELFSTWNPLANPQQHVEVMAKWQELVEGEGAKNIMQQPLGEVPMDPYQQLVWDTWTCAVRSAIMGPWEPRDCVPLIQVFEVWAPPLIPLWIQSHLLLNVVLPRITRAVHNWNPMQDTIPIHTWLHPWLPLLADHLQAVYPVIRQKLSAALVHWHPSDRSAKMVLKPWKGVFSDISMTNLIQSSIQPKLETCLAEMPITPHTQDIDAFHWFRDWEDMIPISISVEILECCFFPKWFQTLGSWLSTNPPYLDVIQWYKAWRDLIPESTANHMQVRQKLQQSLEICKRALSFQPGASDQLTLLLNGLDKLGAPPPPPPVGSPPHQRKKDWAEIISSARRDNLSMKELVERKSQERGIVFVPLPDRNYEGRPVYRCGNLNVSFNKNISYVQTEKGWMPKSLTTLLNDAVL